MRGVAKLDACVHLKHSIDGNSLSYIDSNASFKTILIGDGLLIEKILYKIVLLSHLPNENKHIVYIIDKNADTLFKRLKKAIHYKEDNFPHIELKAISLDINYLEFYEDTVWHENNLENVIICFDDEDKNLECAVALNSRVYFQKSINKAFMPNVLFGIYNELQLSKTINNNINEFNKFFTFGNINDILAYQILIDDENDKIAQLIHYGYGDVYDKEKILFTKENEVAIQKKWFLESKYSDKLSNISQAKHIDMKLKAMGLQRFKCQSDNSNKEKLRLANQKIIFGKLAADREKIGLEENDLIEFSKELNNLYGDKEYVVKYFPSSFDTLFEKMIRMEHNRWNSFHHLNGWKYAPKKDKYKKEHDCLLPLKDFNKNSIKLTVIYDIYSFVYLPNYLAEAGYMVIEFCEK